MSDMGKKTRQCAKAFDCRFRVVLITAVVVTAIGIAAVFAFGA